MRLALAPINPIVGDIDGNVAKITRAIDAARDIGADLVAMPELVVTGYPPKDLLLRPSFVERCERAASQITAYVAGKAAAGVRGIHVALGCPRVRDGLLRNSAMVIAPDGSVNWHDKQLLPDYDVFDEPRYFAPGDTCTVIEVAGERVGIAICEDLWHGEDAHESGRYRAARDPMQDLRTAGVQGLIVISASPYVSGKTGRQRAIVEAHARRLGAWIAEVNQLGGNDELVFDGVAVFAPRAGPSVTNGFASDTPLIVDTRNGKPVNAGEAEGRAEKIDADPTDAYPIDADREVIDILTLGIRDYVEKTRHPGVVIGLSGGIDSALVATLAVRALGPERVLGLLMPGPYSSEHSVTDALELADRLAIKAAIAPITDVFAAGEAALSSALEGGSRGARAGSAHGLLSADMPQRREGDVTEQNLQSRARGLTLMGVSNATGHLVLATGNKSELATGYCTLYGDMIGALAPLSDLFKTRVYAVARAINARAHNLGFARPPIPEGTISKPPSAELAPNQTDQDTLPPYETLDALLTRMIEERMSPAQAAADAGLPAETALRVARMLRNAEYKRWQLPIGIKLSRAAFGFGRRYPVVSAWCE